MPSFPRILTLAFSSLPLFAACKTDQRTIPGAGGATVAISVIGALTSDTNAANYAYALTGCLTPSGSGTYSNGTVSVTAPGIRLGLSNCTLQVASSAGSSNIVYSGSVSALTLNLTGQLIANADVFSGGGGGNGFNPPSCIPPPPPPPPPNITPAAPSTPPSVLTPPVTPGTPPATPGAPTTSPNGVSISIGSSNCTAPQVYDPTQFKCVTPAGATGSGS